jgi:hypothetical protein
MSDLPTLDPTLAAFAGWADAFGRYNDPVTIDAIVQSATQLANDLRAFPVAVTDLQPGNGTRYVVSVSSLTGPTALGVPWSAADSLGGQHIISLPLQHRCAVFTLVGLWTPEWIKDEFRLTRDDDALLYAGLLSVTGDLLAA